MVSPAPLASTPTSPSSSMYLRPSPRPRCSSAVARSSRAKARQAPAGGTAPSRRAPACSRALVHRAIRQDRQRVDFDQLGVALRQSTRRAARARRATASSAAPQAETRDHAAGRSLIEAGQHVDGLPSQRAGTGSGYLLDIHAALGREQHQRSLARSVLKHGAVEFARDIGSLLDQHGFDGVAGYVHAQDRPRGFGGLFAACRRGGRRPTCRACPPVPAL